MNRDRVTRSRLTSALARTSLSSSRRTTQTVIGLPPRRYNRGHTADPAHHSDLADQYDRDDHSHLADHDIDTIVPVATIDTIATITTIATIDP